MGDNARHKLLADLIRLRFPDRAMHVVDVAAGRGQLKRALERAGYRHVTCWDRRHKQARPRPGQYWQEFHWRLAPDDYDLVAAMHPDEATDHAILYAARVRVPFLVCPCCIKPSGSEFMANCFDRAAWFRHLTRLARERDMRVIETRLPMNGANVVFIGYPKESRRWEN